MLSKSIMNSPTDSMNDEVKKYMEQKNDIQIAMKIRMILLMK